MATINYASVGNKTGTATVYKWETLTENDAGQGLDAQQFPDRSVQVVIVGGTGTINIEGSNDEGLNWFILNDIQGNALTFTESGLKGVAELTDLIRPKPSAGSSLDCDVFMLVGGRYQ